VGPKNYFLIIELSIQEIFYEDDRFGSIVFEVVIERRANYNGIQNWKRIGCRSG